MSARPSFASQSHVVDLWRSTRGSYWRTPRNAGQRLPGLDVGEATRRVKQPGVIGLATWTAPKVGCRTGEYKGWIFAGQLQFDVGVQDFLTGGAARISVLGA
jgi:hypothetical protein